MKVTILGCGVMGSAFARQLVKKQGISLILCDRGRKKGEQLAAEIGATFISDPSEAVSEGDVLLLATKPTDLEGVAESLEGIRGKIVFSILAGISLEQLKSSFPHSKVVRSMPNLALMHGESVIALVDDPQLGEEVKQKIDDLLDGMGLIYWTEEAKIDCISALAGSGPAFIVAVIEAMVESGIGMGLKADEALKLSLQTVVGTVALIKNHSGHPGGVRWQICVPAGTTIAGMRVLEESGVRAGLINTFLETYYRNKEE